MRLGAGRLLTADGPVRLSGILSLKYLWSREQDYSESVYEPGVDESTRYVRMDRDDWSLDLGLRVSAAITERFWIETRFGLTYSWRETKIDSTERRLSNSQYSEDVEASTSKTKTFDDYGWNGLGRLDFVFWF